MTTFYPHHERHPTETTTFRRKERPIRVEAAAAVRMVPGHVAPSRVVEPPGTNVGRAVRRGPESRSDGAGGERPRHARLQRTRVALHAVRQICGLPAQDGIEPEQHDRRKRIEQLGSTDPEPGCEVDQAAPIEQGGRLCRLSGHD
jgi:hypothetical protein